MNKLNEASLPVPAERSAAGFALATGILILCFARPLYQLARFSFGNELYSHILLVPVISGYLAWLNLKSLHGAPGSARRWALVPFLAGVAVLGLYAVQLSAGVQLVGEDALAHTTLAFVLLFGSACCFFLGSAIVRAVAFPLGLLLFMVPLPSGWLAEIDTFLQHGSAATAHWLFDLAGTPLLFSELTFRLPGITLLVAPECSGIHSTVALLITSLVAGYVFLHSCWNRTILAAAVIPLALLRNGMRIFVIGELCVQVGPEMIHSYIHKHGGPVFFALSLVPFFLLLLFLMKLERPRNATH
jgi:exosortase C (VPDSG-CTERM-specific)